LEMLIRVAVKSKEILENRRRREKTDDTGV